MTSRLERCQAALDEAEIDALFVASPVDDVLGAHSANRRYISGFTGSTGYVLITRTRAAFAADFRYTEQADQEVIPNGFTVYPANGGMRHWWPTLIGEMGLAGKRIGLSRADTTLGLYTGMWDIIAKMPEADAPSLVPAPGILEKLRQVKSADELATIQRAINVSDAALADVASTIAAGQTERHVADDVATAVRARGGDGISFDTIVAAGEWGARPHATPRDVEIEAGQPVVIDMGARVDGYCSDLTRTIGVGEMPPKFREIYEIVQAAQANAIERVEAGMSGKDAHELAQSVIRDAGYDAQFGHGLGHGVGLEVHEDPYLGKTSEATLEEGMVFTIEPGIYLPGWGGVRIEDIVVLENGRARVLSRAPRLTFGGQ